MIITFANEIKKAIKKAAPDLNFKAPEIAKNPEALFTIAQVMLDFSSKLKVVDKKQAAFHKQVADTFENPGMDKVVALLCALPEKVKHKGKNQEAFTTKCLQGFFPADVVKAITALSKDKKTLLKNSVAKAVAKAQLDVTYCNAMAELA